MVKKKIVNLKKKAESLNFPHTKNILSILCESACVAKG